MIDRTYPGFQVALITQGYQTAGGVQTVARWLVGRLSHLGYGVTVFDLATSRSDAYSRRLLSPSSWFRRSLLYTDVKEPGVIHVGANIPEIETQRYRPRRDLTVELSRFDLIQVVSGGPALSYCAKKTALPIVLQVATTVASERAPATNDFKTAMGVWRRVMLVLTQRMERVALRCMTLVLVENQVMRRFVQSVSSCRVKVAVPGIDTELFTPPLGGWSNRGYLLSVCRLNDRRKGLDRIIRSYGLMTKSQAGLPRLILAGRGQLPGSLDELIDELGLRDNIDILANVPQDDLPDLYRSGSVYLQASHEEGLGMSVIEAMACGLPVVASHTAGTAETVSDGITGFLIVQGPQVERDMAERALFLLNVGADDMARAARTRAVSLFGQVAAFDSYSAEYHAILELSRRDQN